MSSCDICDELAAIKATLADHGDKLTILLTGVGALVSTLLGNYWNPADKGADIVLSGANDEASNPSFTYQAVRSVTSRASGKYYAEMVINMTTADSNLGFANATFDVSVSNYVGVDANGVSYYTDDGGINENASSTAYGNLLSAGDVLGIALDIDNSLAYFAVNGVWQNSADPAGGTGGYAFSATGPFMLACTPGDISAVVTLRTADGDFTQTKPTGFSAWG